MPTVEVDVLDHDPIEVPRGFGLLGDLDTGEGTARALPSALRDLDQLSPSVTPPTTGSSTVSPANPTARASKTYRGRHYPTKLCGWERLRVSWSGRSMR